MGASLSPPLPGVLNTALNAASYGILFPLFALRWKQLSYVATRDIPLLLLVVTTIASIFWSAAPEISLNEIKPFIRSTLLGLYLARYYSIKDLIRLFTWIFSLATILSLIFALALPAYGTYEGITSPWRGVFLYKNILARTATLAGMLFLAIAIDNPRKRGVALAGFGLAVADLLGSQGKTSLASFFILLCLLPIYISVKQNYKMQMALYAVLVLLGGWVVIWSASNFETIIVDGLHKDLTFSGRKIIWDLSLEKAWERPWLGYGYVGFWPSENALHVINNSWASGSVDAGVRFNAHSNFIDLFLQVGGLGFSFYILNYLTVFLRVVALLSLTRNIEFLWLLQFIVGQTLFNLSDSATILSGDGFWAIYVSIVCSTALHYNRFRKNQLDRLRSSGNGILKPS
jgi:O-antigen ligase